MANATAITVTDLVANGSVSRPAGDTLDTGTSAVTIEASLSGKSDRVILEVTNGAAEALSVQVAAGEDPPAFRHGIGALTAVSIAQNGVKILGPFESARVIQNDGKLKVTFTPGGTINATVRCYRLPKA
jgi:hypothetical protein